MTRRTLQIIGYGPMKGMFQLVTDQIGDYWSRAAKVLMPEGIACPLVGKKTAIRIAATFRNHHCAVSESPDIFIDA